jgi:hypothetical protein
MIQYAPHIAAAAGTVLLMTATMVKTTGLTNGFLFRVLPVTVGAASLWMSAAQFMAGTS